jgi:hypothetical protein
VLSVRQAQSPTAAAPRASANDARDLLHAQPSV